MLRKPISMFLVLAIATFFNACFANPLNNTPKCSDLAVINTLTEILNTDNKKVTVDIDTVKKKLDLGEHRGMRSCYASVDYFNNFNGMTEVTQISYTVAMDETRKKHIVTIVEQ